MGFYQQGHSFMDANITICTNEQHRVDGSHFTLRQLNIYTAAWSFGWFYQRHHVQPAYHRHQCKRIRFERQANLLVHTSATYTAGMVDFVHSLLHTCHQTALHLQYTTGTTWETYLVPWQFRCTYIQTGPRLAGSNLFRWPTSMTFFRVGPWNIAHVLYESLPTSRGTVCFFVDFLHRIFNSLCFWGHLNFLRPFYITPGI